MENKQFISPIYGWLVALPLGILGIFQLIIQLSGAMNTLPNKPEFTVNELVMSSGILFGYFLCCLFLIYYKARSEILVVLKLQPTTIKIIFWGCLAVVGLGILVDEFAFLLCQIFPSLESSSILGNIDSLLLKTSPTEKVIVCFLIVILAPLYEEILLRGFIQSSFESQYSPSLIAFFSGLIFAVWHGDLLQGFGAFIAGYYLSWLTIKARSIYPALIAHIINNGTYFFTTLFLDDWLPRKQITEEGYPIWVVLIAGLLFLSSVTFISRKQSKNYNS
jgi:membrane protease YdiL (CAAX protease family)